MGGHPFPPRVTLRRREVEMRQMIVNLLKEERAPAVTVDDDGTTRCRMTVRPPLPDSEERSGAMKKSLGASLIGLLAAVVVVVPTSPAHADEQGFKLTTVDRFVSVVQVGDQVFIDSEGSGHSRLLGDVTSTTSIMQTLVPGCDPASGVITMSAEGGTLTINGEALVCDTEIAGSWEVTGGTGAFAGASGGGTLQGTPSHGQNPVVLHWEGSLSF
jgi:hypothetical protein